MKTGFILEDLPESQAWLRDALEQSFPGIAIDSAYSLAEAAHKLAAGPAPDIALIDLGLPDGSGIDLIAEWRAADPALPADRAGVLWRPEIAPGLVVPFDGDPSAAAEWRAAALLKAARRTADGLHLRFESGLQLQFCGAARAGQPLFVVLAFDRDLGLRIDAVERLNRTLSGRPSAPSHWTRGQRERLAKSLAALDGALMGETYRQIAARLFGRHAGADEPWPTSSIRATTIRLVQSGRRLMGGGYRQLLRKGL